MQTNNGVFKENVSWRNNVSFKKETEKIVLLQMKGLIYCQVQDWNLFPWRKINWYLLQIAKGHFSYTIWLMISKKSIMAYTFPSLWWGTHVSKVSANKVYRKNCLLEFPVLLALNYYLHVYLWFLQNEHIYTYRKKKFQNILERK